MQTLIKDILLTGSAEDKRTVFAFDSSTPHEKIAKKFKLFARSQFPRYFKGPSAPFHDEMILNTIESYYGLNYLNIAFRGSAKTTFKKLFDVFVLLNDRDEFRKYLKILTKDGKNSKQIVTDVYNLIVEVRPIYGDVFEQEGDIKREETMSSFTMKNGTKYAAGTVGQTQRGHIQDAYRPDWVWFEDVEDRESIASMVVTQGIINKCSEAIDGLSKNGSYLVTANYISDQGTIQWFKNKPSVKTQITAILDENNEPTWSIYSKEEIEAIRADADDFYGEYMCDPQRSENKFFNIERIEADMKLCTNPVREDSGVRYWANYNPTHRYAQASDHSDGIGKDANTLAGFDHTTGELVYTYANNQIAPDVAARQFAGVGAEFGYCVYAPEVNNKCGGIVINTLRNLPNTYPRIFQRIKRDRSQIVTERKLGWETNGKTKRDLVFKFRIDYNKGLIKIRDLDVLKEMKAYTNDDLSEDKITLITRHFDLLMSVMIAWYMRDVEIEMPDDYDKEVDEYLNAPAVNFM